MNDDRKKNAESENKKMFRSRFDIFVLNALADKNGASYGYDVINYIQTRTKGHYKIKTFSTIYNTLKRLEEQGYVVSGKGDGETNGATRVYYTLTEAGEEYLSDNKLEYKYLRTLLDNLLTDEEFDLENDEIPYSASELKPLTRRVRADAFSDDEGIAPATEEEEIAASVPQPATDPVVGIDDDGSVDVISVVPSPVAPVTKSTKKTYHPTAYKTVFEKIATPVIRSEGGRKPGNTKAESLPTRNKVVAAKPYSEKKPSAEPVNNVERLKRSLQSEGYTFATYQSGAKKERAAVPSKKYVYINKLMRDCVVLSALYVVACSLFLFLMRDTFRFSLAAMISCMAVAFTFALIFAIIWFRNPDKKKKDTINLKILNTICIVLFTVFFLLDLIISLVAIKRDGGLHSPVVYTPVIVASVSVVFGVFFTALYKSDRYITK